MPRSRAVTLLLRAAVAGALALVAGCSGDPSSDEVDWSPLPAVSYDAPTPVADRDQPTVQRTLATVDTCGLLDRKALAAAGVEGARRAYLEPVSPSECYLGYNILYVRLYEALPSGSRFSWAREQVGDHLAFTQAREEAGGCRVGLPVDLDHVVMVASLTKRCPEVLAAAGVVADGLAADDVALRPAGVLRAPACGLAAAATGLEPDSPRLVAGPDGPDGADLDDCEILSPDDDPAPGVDVSLDFGPPVARLLANGGYRRVSIGGQVVSETGGRRDCFLHADLPARDPSTTPDRSVLSLMVHTSGCRAGRAIVPGLLRAAADPAVTAGAVLPLADVAVRADEPTSLTPGVCEDVPVEADQCVPLDDTDVEVPDDPVQLLRQGEADPAVVCAAATETVREAYGDAMTPAVVIAPGGRGRTCTFASPDHLAQVDVAAVTAVDGRPLDGTVAGHPANLPSESDIPTIALLTWTVALTSADEPGRLVVSVTCLPERGAIYKAPYDPACADRADGLATDLATRLLG